MSFQAFAIKGYLRKDCTFPFFSLQWRPHQSMAQCLAFTPFLSFIAPLSLTLDPCLLPSLPASCLLVLLEHSFATPSPKGTQDPAHSLYGKNTGPPPSSLFSSPALPPATHLWSPQAFYLIYLMQPSCPIFWSLFS